MSTCDPVKPHSLHYKLNLFFKFYLSLWALQTCRILRIPGDHAYITQADIETERKSKREQEGDKKNEIERVRERQTEREKN